MIAGSTSSFNSTFDFANYLFSKRMNFFTQFVIQGNSCYNRSLANTLMFVVSDMKFFGNKRQ